MSALSLAKGHTWLKQRKDTLSLLLEAREEGPKAMSGYGKSQVNGGMDFHFTFPPPAFTREKVGRAAAKHHSPMFHAGQWQGWGQQCVIFES